MAAVREEAAAPQPLQLKEAMRLLSNFPRTCRVVFEDGRGVGTVDSYRGYYQDLALEPSIREPGTVGQLLDLLDSAWGRDFHGYKGGTYTMTGRTLLWVACWGDASGLMLTRIVGRAGTDLVVLKTEQEVW